MENAEALLEIVLYAHQCAIYLKANILAFSRQSFKKWQLTVIEDGSKDDTYRELQRLVGLYGLTDKVQIRRNDEKLGFLSSVVPVIRALGNTDRLILLMTGEFRFAHERVLEKIISVHQSGWEMTLGKWKNKDQLICQNAILHPFQPMREQPWAFCAPFSFRKKYFDQIQDREIKDEQEQYFDAMGFQALAFPIFEQSIKRRLINEVLFMHEASVIDPFDDDLNWRDQLLSADQRRCLNALSKISPKITKVDQSFFQENSYEFMESAFLGERSLSRLESLDYGSSIPADSIKRSNTKTEVKLPPNPFSVPKSNESEKPSALANAILPQPTPTPEQKEEQEFEFEIEDMEWFAQQKQYTTALEIGKKLLAKKPENARIHTNMGVIYWSLEESKQGMNHFVQAMKYDKNNRDPVMNCAAAWVELGQIEQAKRLCQIFLTAHPDDQPILNLLEELKQKKL
jgi:tetratricopeptide (TPR) repeat protein